MTKEQCFKVIDEHLGKGWFEMKEDEIVDILKVYGYYPKENVVAVMKGLTNLKLITKDEMDANFRKSGLDELI